ncbi:myosin heavy chain, striated muscle-like isoform X2 [Paramacrobiotus metropolitanus]|uniref:myosin heavy chain, striated muscle-like isoform X2 n=1 Tax=Paramacrobiotus metropolitanus TaxID=2943436 RepID=UPI002445CEBD|nr:myosin heavy chain, striated muscle-like isoform X2 [Paramacrobiotus metropolitanus]
MSVEPFIIPTMEQSGRYDTENKKSPAVSSVSEQIVSPVQTEEPTPWTNERLLESGRNSDNPEYLMGHPHSVDLREGGVGVDVHSIGLWDEEVLALEKQLAEKLERAEQYRENMELLKTKKLRRKHYIETLSTQFRSLQGIKALKEQEVSAAQKQVELKRRETAHIRLETMRTKNEIQHLVQRLDNDQTMIGRLKKEIDDMQTEIDLDRELMGTCLNYAEKHQVEFNMLKQYSLEDEGKIKECRYRVGRLALEDEETAKELAGIEVDVKSLRLEVSRLKENCQSVIQERTEKTDNWDQIKSRIAGADADMKQQQEEIDALEAKCAAKQEALQRQKDFYDSELRNNHETQKKMELTESNAQKAREYVFEMEQKKQEFLDQIHVMDNACSAKQREIRLIQSSINGLRNQTRSVKEDIKRWQDLTAGVESRRRNLSDQNLTDEERLQELNKALDQREMVVRSAEQNLVRLRDQNFKDTQKNLEAKTLLEAIISNIQGSKVYMGSLQRQTRQKNGLARNQAQQMYELQYKITQLNRRISFMEGTDVGPPEKPLGDMRTLSAKQDNLQKEIGLMQSRIMKQDEMIKSLKRIVDQEETDKTKKETALAEVMLYLHTTQRTLDRAQSRKVEGAAELSSSRLKLRYIADKAEEKLDRVTSISIRQAELGGLFKERMAMIQMEREQYKAQTKRMDEQRTWLTKMLREMENHQRGIKTRFELLTMPVALDQDEKDAARDVVQIQAALFVKAARERQAVNDQKAQLIQDIQKVMQDNFRLRQFYEKFEKQTGQMKTELSQVAETSTGLSVKIAHTTKYSKSTMLLTMKSDFCEGNYEPLKTKPTDIRKKSIIFVIRRKRCSNWESKSSTA